MEWESNIERTAEIHRSGAEIQRLLARVAATDKAIDEVCRGDHGEDFERRLRTLLSDMDVLVKKLSEALDRRAGRLR